MSSDFRPSRIATAGAGEVFSLAGVQAFRAASAIAYKLSRVVLNSVAPGVETVFPVSAPSGAPQVLRADEDRVVTLDDVVQGVGTDISIGDGDPDPAGAIVFASAPTEGQVVVVRYNSDTAMDLPAGSVTFVERYSIEAPDAIICTGSEVLEIM